MLIAFGGLMVKHMGMCVQVNQNMGVKILYTINQFSGEWQFFILSMVIQFHSWNLVFCNY